MLGSGMRVEFKHCARPQGYWAVLLLRTSRGPSGPASSDGSQDGADEKARAGGAGQGGICL